MRSVESVSARSRIRREGALNGSPVGFHELAAQKTEFVGRFSGVRLSGSVQRTTCPIFIYTSYHDSEAFMHPVQEFIEFCDHVRAERRSRVLVDDVAGYPARGPVAGLAPRGRHRARMTRQTRSGKSAREIRAGFPWLISTSPNGPCPTTTSCSGTITSRSTSSTSARPTKGTTRFYGSFMNVIARSPSHGFRSSDT